MGDAVLDILSLGLRPLIRKQLWFHNTIVDFRVRLSGLREGNLTVEDLRQFYDEINGHNFSFVIFSGYYKKYIENLNRFRPGAHEENPDITFLLVAIAEDRWKPTKFWAVFNYHLKYRIPVISKIFLANQKKRNRKKLDRPNAVSRQQKRFDETKKWTRVPINRGVKKE